MMRRNLKDMIVIITGASAGIGKALAEQLHAREARLVLAARRLDRLEELNRSLGGKHLCLKTDVAQLDDCRSLIEQTVARFGRIDTLVCNAGFGFYRTFMQTSPEEARQIFATNVLGTTDCIHFALPYIQKQELRDGFRGQIMVVSSFVARRGIPFIATYSATKAAQLALAEGLRVELKPMKIAVTSVHPVQTSTEFGEVARSLGAMKIADAPIAQTAQTVARKMVRAIVSPRPEVWPHGLSRLLSVSAALSPRLADRAMVAYRKKVESENLGADMSR